MMNNLQQQKKAFDRGKRNSQIAEEYIHRKYGYKINDETPLDSMNSNIEVKSCQMLLTDIHDSSFRKGIFIIRKPQHNILLERNGSYYFVLMHYKQVIGDVRKRADHVDAMVSWDHVGYSKIPWNEVFSYSEIFKFVKEVPPADLIPSKTFEKKMMGYLR